jgi:E3 ubiquitin-protein ligase synoviolin
MGFPPVPAFPLSTLTDEQLQELEGRERANVEARITLLRNIHSLLDTAIAQLHYYSQAAAVNTGVSPPVDLSSTSLSPEDEAVRVVASEEVTEMETSMEGASVDSDVHELRQRRLSRFDSSPASVNRQNSNLQDETEEGNSG